MVRDELVEKLRASLARSWEMITSPDIDAKSKERWTQIYTNTAQALNEILKDRQNRDWEERLREMEAARKIPTSILRGNKPKQVKLRKAGAAKETATTAPDSSEKQEGS